MPHLTSLHWWSNLFDAILLHNFLLLEGFLLLRFAFFLNPFLLLLPLFVFLRETKIHLGFLLLLQVLSLPIFFDLHLDVIFTGVPLIGVWRLLFAIDESRDWRAIGAKNDILALNRLFDAGDQRVEGHSSPKAVISGPIHEDLGLQGCQLRGPFRRFLGSHHRSLGSLNFANILAPIEAFEGRGHGGRPTGLVQIIFSDQPHNLISSALALSRITGSIRFDAVCSDVDNLLLHYLDVLLLHLLLIKISQLQLR